MPTATDPLLTGIQGIHRAITRALSVLVDESKRLGDWEGVDRKTTEGFRLYAHTFCDLLHAHHDGEEEIGFPRLRANLSPEVEATLTRQHQDMLGAHHAIQTLVAAPLPWPRETWRGVHRAASLLLPGWIAHRDAEEKWMAEATKEFSLAEKADLAKALEQHGMAHAGPGSLVVPFIIYNLEGPDRAAMCTRFPFILKSILVPYVWRGTYRPMLPFLLPR
jgi:hypothetical protein